MPAKGTKTTKPKVVKVKSNTVKSNTKTALLNKKIKFNWKIAAVIGVILVAALGYLFVRLSQAGNADLSVGEISPENGAQREYKNAVDTKIVGPGFGIVYMPVKHKAYPVSWDQKTRYTVTYYTTEGLSTGNVGVYLDCDENRRRIASAAPLFGAVIRNGNSLSVDANYQQIASYCGTGKAVKLKIGIERGFYITGVSVQQPATSGPVSIPAPQPNNACSGVYGQGNQGDCVVLIQTKLKQLGYDPGPIDGIYGSKTAGAVRQFQSKAGLTQDGVVGSQTWSKLFSTSCGQPAAKC